LYKIYYIPIKKIGENDMKTLGYIYGIILRVFEKTLSVEEALMLIKDVLS